MACFNPYSSRARASPATTTRSTASARYCNLAARSSSSPRARAAAGERGYRDALIAVGRRPRDFHGQVGEFKAGLYHLAKRFPGLPLVPVHLENLNRILPKGTLLPVPLIAQAHFRAPIRLEEGEAKTDFLRRARAVLLDEPAA